MLSRRKLSGDPPETPPRGDFLAKSLANPDKIFKKMQKKMFLIILSGFSSDFNQGVSEGSPDKLRRDNIAGPHVRVRNGILLPKLF